MGFLQPHVRYRSSHAQSWIKSNTFDKKAIPNRMAFFYFWNIWYRLFTNHLGAIKGIMHPLSFTIRYIDAYILAVDVCGLLMLGVTLHKFFTDKFLCRGIVWIDLILSACWNFFTNRWATYSWRIFVKITLNICNNWCSSRRRRLCHSCASTKHAQYHEYNSQKTWPTTHDKHP